MKTSMRFWLLLITLSMVCTSLFACGDKGDTTAPTLEQTKVGFLLHISRNIHATARVISAPHADTGHHLCPASRIHEAVPTGKTSVGTINLPL